jgi:hypothetical protein
MLYGWKLVELQRENDKIEDADSDYRNNPKWKKNRRLQDLLYKKIQERNEQQNEQYLYTSDVLGDG